MPEYQGGRPPKERDSCVITRTGLFLPGIKDDGGQSQAGQLAGVPGRKATHVEGVMCKLPEPVLIFYLGSKTTEGRARLASLPEYQGGRPPT